jgi:hypothetical protein
MRWQNGCLASAFTLAVERVISLMVRGLREIARPVGAISHPIHLPPKAYASSHRLYFSILSNSRRLSAGWSLTVVTVNL